jgi:hypothetical protein
MVGGNKTNPKKTKNLVSTYHKTWLIVNYFILMIKIWCEGIMGQTIPDWNARYSKAGGF